jgi:hypothetical protein
MIIIINVIKMLQMKDEREWSEKSKSYPDLDVNETLRDSIFMNED